MASTTTGPRWAMLARAGRATVAALAFGAALLVATPARADCLLLDLDCVTEAASDAATEAAVEATEVVDEVVEGVTDATEPATTTVVGVVESVVTTVEETVDDVIAVVEETVEGAVGGGSPEEPRPGTDGEIVGDRPEADPGSAATVPSGPGPETVTPHAPAGPEATLAGAGSPSFVGATPAASGAAPAFAAPPDTATDADAGAAERLAGSSPAVRDAGPSALAEAARTLAFPLALTVLIALFLLAQHRLDRRTPKLALAPVEPDVVGFRRAPGR